MLCSVHFGFLMITEKTGSKFVISRCQNLEKTSHILICSVFIEFRCQQTPNSIIQQTAGFKDEYFR